MKKTVKVVAAVIRNNEGRILATRRGQGAQAGGWEFPGGKIERGETPQQALHREIVEELSMDIAIGESIAVVEHDYGDFHLEMECFWCDIRGQVPVLHEHLEARWLAIDESLPQAVEWLPADRQLLPLLALPRFGEIEVVGQVPDMHMRGRHPGVYVNYVPAAVKQIVVRARMLNLSNFGTDSIVSVTIPTAESLHIEIERVELAALDIWRPEKGDLVLTPMPTERRQDVEFSMSVSAPAEECASTRRSRRSRSAEVKKEKPAKKRGTGWFGRLRDLRDSRGDVHEINYDYQYDTKPSQPSWDVKQDVEIEEEIPDYDAQRRQALNEIEAMILDYVTRYHADPKALLTKISGKIIVNPSEVSPLHVNSNLDIVLPNYNEKVVDLYPQAKTVYFLMLRHPEGIVLKNMSDYADEMQMIYDLIKPGRDDDKARKVVESLCDPTSGRMQQVISRVRKAFDSVIYNNDIASNYYIDGERGKPYRIALPADQITLPAVLQP